MTGERKFLPIGSKVVIRSSGKEGVVVRLASNGKWLDMIMHQIDCGEVLFRKKWYEAYDLLLLEPREHNR
jgi:hypothetical protein